MKWDQCTALVGGGKSASRLTSASRGRDEQVSGFSGENVESRATTSLLQGCLVHDVLGLARPRCMAVLPSDGCLGLKSCQSACFNYMRGTTRDPRVPLPSRPGLAPDGTSDPHGRKYNGDVGAPQAGRTEGQQDHVLRVGAPKMPRGYHAAPTVLVIVPHHGVPEEGSERSWGLFSCPACQSQPSVRPAGYHNRMAVSNSRRQGHNLIDDNSNVGCSAEPKQGTKGS